MHLKFQQTLAQLPFTNFSPSPLQYLTKKRKVLLGFFSHEGLTKVAFIKIACQIKVVIGKYCRFQHVSQTADCRFSQSLLDSTGKRQTKVIKL